LKTLRHDLADEIRGARKMMQRSIHDKC